MKFRNYYIFIGIALFLLFRKDDGLLPSSAVTGINELKNFLGMKKGGVNNPGNIRTSDIKWRGETTKPGDTFESYDTIENGIHAMYMNLLSYRKRGVFTINDIINTWAPAKDNNNVPAYIETVTNFVGIPEHSPIDLIDYPLLISAMSKVEGNHFVTAEQVKAVV